MHDASVTNSEALQVSPNQRLYMRCECHKFGGFMYVASVINSEALHALQLSLTTGF